VERLRVTAYPHAAPMDLRTKVFLASASLALLVVTGLTYAGLRDVRVIMTGLFVAVVAPAVLTIVRAQDYLPRAHAVRRRQPWNLPLGIPLGVAVFYVWKLFSQIYLAFDEVVWGREDIAGTAYLEGLQVALDTAGGYVLGLFLGAIVVFVQAAVWIVPAYLLARWMTRPIEEEVERFYRQKVRQSTRQFVGRSRRVTKFKVGGELVETRMQLREYATILVLLSGLVTMLALAWLTPLV
jgi:hypothetical protein